MENPTEAPVQTPETVAASAPEVVRKENPIAKFFHSFAHKDAALATSVVESDVAPVAEAEPQLDAIAPVMAVDIAPQTEVVESTQDAETVPVPAPLVDEAPVAPVETPVEATPLVDLSPVDVVSEVSDTTASFPEVPAPVEPVVDAEAPLAQPVETSAPLSSFELPTDDPAVEATMAPAAETATESTVDLVVNDTEKPQVF